MLLCTVAIPAKWEERRFFKEDIEQQPGISRLLFWLEGVFQK